MAQPLMPNTGYTTQGTKTKDVFLSVTILFRGLVSLTWIAHINTCSYIDDTALTTQTPSAGLRHPSFGGRCRKAMIGVWSQLSPCLSVSGSTLVCGETWLDKTVPGKKCLVEIQKRKRNFMNIITSTCFKQFFYRCFLLTVKPKQSHSQSIHFPGIASCLPLSSGGKTTVFETYLVQWNVGQSSCHDPCLGNR